MYYEEQMIGGILHYRTNPNYDFVPYTLEELSRRYRKLEEENNRIVNHMDELHDYVNKIYTLVSKARDLGE